MYIRDRVKELRRVKASTLRPSAVNWRTHPPQQRDALRGVLAEIGYAAALVARELADGSLELIDGHLRAETTPDMDVPVLVLDVSEEEAAKLLATFDPLSAMAGTHRELLDELLEQVTTSNTAVQEVLDKLASESPRDARADAQAPSTDVELHESYQVVIECRDEAEQREVYERMRREGHQCRVLTL